MKKLLLGLLGGVLSSVGFSQNLVQNPHANPSERITYRSQIDRADGWSDANGGSVDLFQSGAKKRSGVGIPDNYVGTQQHDGSYAGFVAYYDDQRVSLIQTIQHLEVMDEKAYQRYSEYPQCALSEALVAGQKYLILVEVSLAENSGRAVKGLGVYVSKEPLAVSNNAQLAIQPQVIYNEFITNESGWTTIRGEYTAVGGERYLVIGAFEGSSTTKSVVTPRQENDNKRAYYYLKGASVTKVMEKDSDGDGILDKNDECPDAPGTVNGCPDRDKDGIADHKDDCPDVAGIPEKKGCPKEEKDSDGDGVADAKDECPTEPGTVKGCPDRDKDGVADKDDDCPDVKGLASLNGCALSKSDRETIRKASEAIYFNTGSATIKDQSFPELNKLADLLKSHPEVEASIEGHTDSQGNDASNLKLSNARAKAVKDYLISKGVEASHLSSAGYGETKPIADNSTPEGRAQNRRVVINTSTYTEKMKDK